MSPCHQPQGSLRTGPLLPQKERTNSPLHLGVTLPPFQRGDDRNPVGAAIAPTMAHPGHLHGLDLSGITSLCLRGTGVCRGVLAEEREVRGPSLWLGASPPPASTADLVSPLQVPSLSPCLCLAGSSTPSPPEVKSSESPPSPTPLPIVTFSVTSALISYWLLR